MLKTIILIFLVFVVVFIYCKVKYFLHSEFIKFKKLKKKIKKKKFDKKSPKKIKSVILAKKK